MSETDKKEWVDWQNTKVLQKAVVIDNEGNLLAIKRVSTGPGSRLDKWDLPGGSIGPEDLIEGTKPNISAMLREIKEETGLDVKSEDIEPIFVDSWVFNKTPGAILGMAIGYKAKIKDTKPQINLSNEHTESLWATKEELLNLDFGEDGGLHSSIIKKI